MPFLIVILKVSSVHHCGFLMRVHCTPASIPISIISLSLGQLFWPTFNDHIHMRCRCFDENLQGVPECHFHSRQAHHDHKDRQVNQEDHRHQDDQADRGDQGHPVK